jgi:hypothetical protein
VAIWVRFRTLCTHCLCCKGKARLAHFVASNLTESTWSLASMLCKLRLMSLKVPKIRDAVCRYIYRFKHSFLLQNISFRFVLLFLLYEYIRYRRVLSQTFWARRCCHMVFYYWLKVYFVKDMSTICRKMMKLCQYLHRYFATNSRTDQWLFGTWPELQSRTRFEYFNLSWLQLSTC